MTWTVNPATLENEYGRLTPVTQAAREPLRAVALDPDIWRYFTSRIETDADFDSFFDTALAAHTAGSRTVYVITDKKSGRVAGSTSYLSIAERDLRLEIGASWLGRDFRGRGVNHCAKTLLLENAFENLGAERVEFKTDVLNAQARRGLANIGAVEEGIARSYNFMPGGRRRDAAFYSIVRADWPRVREVLTAGRKAAATV